jgi:hypothetical protein
MKGGIFSPFFMYVIQHCVICRTSDSTVSEDAGIEPRTVTTLALTARRSHQCCGTVTIYYGSGSSSDF